MRVRIIRSLGKTINLWDIQSFEKYLREANITNGRREVVSQACSDWCKWKGFEFKAKKYRREEKLPLIPREEQLDQLIAASGFRLGCFLQILK